MALSDEQRAMLQLLLEGGQGYDDIGSLLGISAGDVRARARDALREMGGADPDASVQLSDYLLGQADPIGRADAVRHLQNDPEANALATRLVSQLRLLAPKGELPDIPEPRGGRRARAAGPTPASSGAQAPPAAVPASASSTGGRAGSKRSGQLIAVGVGAAVLLVVAVLAIAGVFGGGGGGSSCDTIDSSAAEQAGLPIVPLDAAQDAPERDGCAPTGQAVFTQSGQGRQAQIVLQTNLANLPATQPGQAYIIWLFGNEQTSLPLAQDVVGDDGNLSGAAPIPDIAVAALASFSEVRVSLASTEDAQAAISTARKQRTLPQFIGRPVLAGQLPNLGQNQAGQRQGGGAQGGGSTTTP